MLRPVILFFAALAATPLNARDSLGVYSTWAAFRDAEVPRCYAIAAADADRRGELSQGYASVGTWPRKSVRGQVHFRLSQPTSQKIVSLRIGRRSFSMTANGSNAWAKDAAMDASIVAAMRSAQTMTLRSRGTSGRRFSDVYSLAGAASALDAATLACPRQR